MSRSRSNSQVGSWVVLAVGVAMTLAAFWWVLQRVSIGELLTQLRGANWVWALPLLLALAVHFWMKVARWSVLLKPLGPVPGSRLWAPTVLGYFANNLLPAHLGELVRMHLAARRLGMRQLSVLTTLVVERVFDFLAIMALFGCGVALGSGASHELTALGVATVAAALGCLVALLVFRRIGARWHAVRSHGRFMDFLWTVWEGLQVLDHPRLLWNVALNSVIQWLLSAATIYFAFRAFDVSLSWSATLILLGVTTLASMLPAAPGYFGVMQAAFVLVAAPLGLAEDLALSASVLFHLVTWLAINLAGLYFLLHLGFGLGDLGREAREAADEMASERAP